MRFVPVNFCLGNRTILKPNGREALQLPPIAATETLLQMSKVADAVSDSYDLDGPNIPEYFERSRHHLGRLSRQRPGC